jgi:hypothetical protein
MLSLLHRRARRGGLIAATGAVLMLSTGLAQAQRWDRYLDAESGHSFELPRDRFSEVENRDGQTIFEDPSGEARIASFHGELPPGTALPDIENMVATAEWIRNVTYRAGGKSWFVLSGHYVRDAGDRDPVIFYFKAMMNAERTRYSAIEVSYPTSRKVEFDPIVTRLEKSLRPPE